MANILFLKLYGEHTHTHFHQHSVVFFATRKYPLNIVPWQNEKESRVAFWISEKFDIYSVLSSYTVIFGVSGLPKLISILVRNQWIWKRNMWMKDFFSKNEKKLCWTYDESMWDDRMNKIHDSENFDSHKMFRIAFLVYLFAPWLRVFLASPLSLARFKRNLRRLV